MGFGFLSPLPGARLREDGNPGLLAALAYPGLPSFHASGVRDSSNP
jgi:hypothetical protein